MKNIRSAHRFHAPWIFFICLALSCFLCACAKAAPEPEKEEAPHEATPSALPQSYEGLVITECMAKNTAVLLHAGVFPDWVELGNLSDSDIRLNGCTLSDGSHSCSLGEYLLQPGEVLLLFSGKEEGELPFALSEQDCLTLCAPDGTILSECDCGISEENCSLIRDEGGAYTLCSAPTPGFANTEEGYEDFQRSLSSPRGLRINEVFAHGSEDLGTTDWIELYNAGDVPVNLAEYTLSDSADEPGKLSLPEQTLESGAFYLCELRDDTFSLNAEKESVYLSSDGMLQDYLCLLNIPTSGTLGREGDDGWYVYASPTPGSANYNGCRKVAESPVLLCEDGVFAPGMSVELTLGGKGTIHYTTDCSIPDESSPVYTEPFFIASDTVLRAISVEEGKLVSDPLTASFYFTDCSLPVVSLIGDEPPELEHLKTVLRKVPEISGNLSYYSENLSFSVPCGIALSGNSSVKMATKSFKVSFRSCYGADSLSCDLFDTGLGEQHSLILRKGADALSFVYKNELFESLALSFTDRCAVKHSRFCRMYINGSYWGLVSMKEDFSRTYFANTLGGEKSDVEYFKFPANNNRHFYETVLPLCKKSAAFSDADYAEFCSMVDVDSLIDFLIVKGFAGDIDYYPNVACFRSPATDNLWRFALWDFDLACTSPFANITVSSVDLYFSMDLMRIAKPLFGNEAFRQRFLNRLAEALNGPLSEENVLSVMAQYDQLLAEEVKIDWAYWNKSYERWSKTTSSFKYKIESGEWRESLLHGVETLSGMKYTNVRDALQSPLS